MPSHKAFRNNACLKTNKLHRPLAPTVRRAKVCSFRVLSRPFAADGYLTGLVTEFIDKGKSITKMVTYSHFVKDLYSANKLKSTQIVKIAQSVKDFAWAPQRFDSLSKTLIRLVLTFDAVMVTLCQVFSQKGRSSAEGLACFDTLQHIDTEAALQLGLMADYAREVHRVVEACDQSDVDTAEVPQMAENLGTILHRMFVNGAVLEMAGLTSVMMATLKTQRTYLMQGVAKTIGSRDGVPPDVVQRCMRRMANVTMTALSVLRGEFSDWAIVNSFKAFSLTRGMHKKYDQKDRPAERVALLERLAKAINLDPRELIDQFFVFEPLAIQAAKTKANTRLSCICRRVCRVSAEAFESRNFIGQQLFTQSSVRPHRTSTSHRRRVIPRAPASRIVVIDS